MMKQSIVLETTILWKTYKEKMSIDKERIIWLENVYEASVTYLNDVRKEFKNYTMHDGTHVINVLEAMGGLLGDYIEKLTVGELELLILVACLHDLGMVYTDEEKNHWFADEAAYKTFLKENCPELLGCEPKDWAVDVQQWYLRMLHPFRVREVLQNNAWKDLLKQCSNEIVPLRCILAVCQAHGENLEEIRNNPNLEYLAASDVDPLFCALLLRLADLLDFDDTRAPKILYSYVLDNEKSGEEWEKHQASAGFRYPASPSTDELPYKACCKNPTIEHAVRKFLDLVDDELDNCARLQRYCKARWQQDFPFPRAVLRREIESDGYMSGDFCLSMDQEQILKLLMGENLYDNRGVFVRELLQNAIDATLLRNEMDSSFSLEEARIDFWEWNDKEGNLWFGIDDQGTGMTLGMLQRYFLKVGNSYYMSQELKRDLRDHGQTEEFHGISRFGIGFLSCFLCADYVEVSTLYFDSQKNYREEPCKRYSQRAKYGLRLQVTGLKGYYTLKNQAEGHQTDYLFPRPDFSTGENCELERLGYRVKPGTSIVMRLDPGRLGTLNLRETVDEYLCGAKMPVYYNDKKIGRTYDEAMKIISELEGEKVYELSPAMKKKFDDCFPAISGNYPKLVQTVISLDDKEGCKILPGLSAVLIKYDVCFEKKAHWKGKDQNYEIKATVYYSKNNLQVGLSSKNEQEILLRLVGGILLYIDGWNKLEKKYGFDKTEALKEKMDLFTACPETEEQLGEVWIPFAGSIELSTVWQAYVNHCYEKSMSIDIEEFGCVCLNSIFENVKLAETTYVYQGVIVGQKILDFVLCDGNSMVFLLEKDCKPKVEVSRSKMVGLPLELAVAIGGILDKYGILNHERGADIYALVAWGNITLREWREVSNSSVGQWMDQNSKKNVQEIIQFFQGQENFEKDGLDIAHSISVHNAKQIMYRYAIAYLQDSYFMTINYEKGQIITFSEKAETDCENIYDIFPPMLFCKAASEQSRKYICHSKSFWRRGITADHPFIVWLLENSVQLNQYFQRQFQQMMDCLYEKDAEVIIQVYDAIREQICILSNKYGFDAGTLPHITLDDFWTDRIENECPF